MGGKLISTGDGLRLVGDAAAMAGQPIQEVASHVGSLFSAITSGTSAGESVSRLQELGLITGATKIKFEELAAAQKKGTAAILTGENALKLLQGVMSRAQGGMAALSNTTEGKLSNMKDNLTQLKVSFGTGFNGGAKIALDAANTKLPELLAKFTEFGTLIGNTISDAVNGDSQRLIMVGSLIGDLIKEGFKLSLRGITDIAGQFFLDFLESQKFNPSGAVSRKLGLAEKHKIGSQYQIEGSLRESAASIKEKYAEALALPTALPQRSGPHPRMPGVSYAPEGYPGIMVDEKGHRIMFDIKTGIDSLNKKLAPQP